MAYACVDDMVLVATRGWAELSERAMPSAQVPGDLLQLTAQHGDRSAYTAAELAAADSVLARLEDALERASRHADTYLFPRYRAALPLKTALIEGSDLPSVIATIALKRLYGTEVPEDIRKGSQWADDYLKDLANGRVSLGFLDTAVAVPTGRVVTASRPKSFDWRGY